MFNKSKSQTVLALATLFSVAASAGNSIEDTHSFRLGVASQKADIQAVSTIDPFPPIEIDFTDDLGMDDKSESIYASYRWRFGEKWSLSAAFQRLDLDGSGAASKDFNYDGVDFTAGVAVSTEYKMDTYLIDVGYSLIRNDQWEVMLGFGLHAFDIETSIAAQVALDDGGEEIGAEGSRAAADFLAPLPNLRAGVTYLITPNWDINAGIGWLSLEIDNIDGNYTYGEISTEYRFTDRFGIGASYQVSQIDVTSDEPDGFDKVDIEFSGPSIYLTYGF